MMEQQRYADVIADITSDRVDRPFQYRIPENMPDLLPGMIVKVPFGNGNRMIRGYVVGTGNVCRVAEDKIKDIAALERQTVDQDGALVGLAAWMKQRYGCTMAQALRTVFPVRKKIKSKEKITLSLCAEKEQAEEALRLMRKKNQKARARLLEALIEEGSLPQQLVREKLNITLPVIKALEEQGLLRIQTRTVYRNPVGDSGRSGNSDGRQVPPLSPLQQEVVESIWQDVIRSAGSKPNGPDPAAPLTWLLHGVTGSGKTFVYMELIARMIERGRQCIVLIPEIALTYQTLIRFYRRFGDRVSVINSRMSAGERYDQFERAGKGEIDVMIGPRSALFTPFPDLGMIVIDEEQEPAYASETVPRYQAREVAFRRAQTEGAVLLLGSATPSLASYHSAKQGRIKLLTMKERAGSAGMAKVSVADMRSELKSGNRSLLSRQLAEGIQNSLDDGGQVMLFLNRRGYAGFTSCRNCGYVPTCPHCDVSLSLHNTGKMVCHYCGYEQEAVRICPVCGSNAVRSFKAGTQQVEQEVAARFPSARILRMDADTTRKKDDYTAILSAFSGHEADILIGTQMIVKGHDFPDVSLVGILAADISLFAPDYRSAERTFQLLTQAAGRAGRADRPGEVIIQTYDPEHYSIVLSAQQDYESFYEKEMEFRSLAGYPPAGALTAVHVSGTDPKLLEQACGYLAAYARRAAAGRKVAVLGPTDESIAKIQDVYRKLIYLKSSDERNISTVVNRLLQYIEMNEGFRTLTIQFEVEQPF